MGTLLAVSNPRKRKTTRRRPTARRPIRRRRRNPLPRAEIIDTVKKGAIGAAGALAVDVAMAKLPIPDNLKTGTMAPAVRGLVGVAIGMLVSKFGKAKRLGVQLADGAVTVAMYGTGKNLVGPSLGLTPEPVSGELFGLGYQDWPPMSSTESMDMGYINVAPTYDMDDF